MANVSAGLIVSKNEKFLMVQERNPEYFGKWTFPCGDLENNESIPDCAKREGNEETGYLFKLLFLQGTYQQFFTSGGNGKGNRIGIVYLAEIIGGEMRLTDEIMAVKWLTFSEIKELEKNSQLKTPFVMRVIYDFLEHMRFSLDSIIIL